jgi:hypothetical protein
MDMRFGMWNVRSLHREGSIMAVLRKLSKYKLDFVVIHEVGWEGGGTKPTGEYIFLWKRK